jgi:hypothetical protein
VREPAVAGAGQQGRIETERVEGQRFDRDLLRHERRRRVFVMRPRAMRVALVRAARASPPAVAAMAGRGVCRQAL